MATVASEPFVRFFMAPSFAHNFLSDRKQAHEGSEAMALAFKSRFLIGGAINLDAYVPPADLHIQAFFVFPSPHKCFDGQ